MDSKHLAHAIKQARKNTGLTQDQLADRAHISYSTLAKIEQGAINQPSVFTIAALGKVLKTGVDRLLSGQASPSKNRTQIKFIYCDVNGVIVGNYQHAFASIAEECGVSFDRVESAFWHLNESANRGELNVNAFNAALAQRLGVDNVDWQKHYFKAVVPIKKTHKLLESLSSSYKIGLLTNTMTGFLPKLKSQGLLPRVNFSVIVDSSKVGMVKPERAIFKLAQQKAAVPPEQILLIDDTKPFISAAKKQGWQTVWFDSLKPQSALVKVEQMLSQIKE